MRPELTVEDLGKIEVSQGDVDALGAAFEQISERLLPEATVSVAEAARDHPEAPGNIVGVGVGEKITSGHATGKPALKILVRQKVDPDRLSEATLVPETINGVLTDVEETGEIVAYQFRNRHRPPPGGVSIGRCDEIAAGTLGCSVLADKDLQILSNNHVMAAANNGRKGDPICQPGRLDGGVCPADVIAELTRFVRIDFGGGSNSVDAAIAAATIKPDPRILRTPGNLEPLRSPEVRAVPGMPVQKSGRTTGWTRGVVDLVGVSINVDYNGPVARFDNQFSVFSRDGAFSAAGDSGSLVTTYGEEDRPSPTQQWKLPDMDNQPVGLLFAGGGGYTFCNHISKVLGALDAQIAY